MNEEIEVNVVDREREAEIVVKTGCIPSKYNGTSVNEINPKRIRKLAREISTGTYTINTPEQADIFNDETSQSYPLHKPFMLDKPHIIGLSEHIEPVTPDMVEREVSTIFSTPIQQENVVEKFVIYNEHSWETPYVDAVNIDGDYSKYSGQQVANMFRIMSPEIPYGRFYSSREYPLILVGRKHTMVVAPYENDNVGGD